MTNGMERGRTGRIVRVHPKIDREYLVPILLKALHILDILSEHENGMSIAELEMTSGYAMSTIYRIVRTLVASGYLVQVKCHKYRRATLQSDIGAGRRLPTLGPQSTRASLCTNSVLLR
jgi:hypothetical protein